MNGLGPAHKQKALIFFEAAFSERPNAKFDMTPKQQFTMWNMTKYTFHNGCDRKHRYKTHNRCVLFQKINIKLKIVIF